MRQITIRYSGECRKCGSVLEVGSAVIYERRVGVFCVGCGPTDTEEIRAYRQEAGDKRADKYEDWAEKRREKAGAVLAHNAHYTEDIAFLTQPGRLPIRDRVYAQNDRACESLNVASGFIEKARALRKVRVAGDAEKKRQETRDALDQLITKGSTVRDFCFGQGVVVQVCKKSYRIRFESGNIYARDKSYVQPIEARA